MIIGLVQYQQTMEEVGVRLRFADNSIRLDLEVIDEATEYKAVWRKVKNSLLKATESRRIEIYKTKEQQSQVYRDQEEECNDMAGAEFTWSKDIIDHDDAGWWRQDHGRYQEDWPKISNAEFVTRETKLWNILLLGVRS